MRNFDKAVNFIRTIYKGELHLQFEMMPAVVVRPSVRQLNSLAATEFDRIFPKPGVRSLPSVLQIEPTNACSLECPLCPSGRHALGRPTGFMTLACFNHLLDEIGSSLSLIILWGWGEPLLHPELPEIICRAKQDNIAVVTSTNGQHMDSELAGRLVASGLDAMVVAVDGATEESYQSYRVGGKLARVLETLGLLREAKSRLHSKFPLINLRMVVNRQNEHEIPLMRNIAGQHGADMLTLRGVAMTDLWDDESDTDYAPADQARSMYRFNQDGKRIKSNGYLCRRPWKRATVTWDGTVVPCEMDYSNSSAFGTFPDDGAFAAVWNGSRAKAFRQVFLQDRMQFEFCARCPFNDRVTEDCTLERMEVNK